MSALEVAWIGLGVFFVLQGISATFIIRSILRLRQTSHRIANHVQVLSGQLQARGLVTLPADDDTPTPGGADV